jgi:hypothetical protein
MEGIEPFPLSLVRFRQLSQRCLQLENLELEVSRTQSDQYEAAIYRSLSRLPRLTDREFAKEEGAFRMIEAAMVVDHYSETGHT